MSRVLGAILAGGASRRFGSDKAQAMLAGRSLIDRAIAAAEREADAVVICGRGYPPQASIADRPRAGMGPLGALAAALHHADRNGFDWVLTLPCDVPFPPTGLRAMLEAAAINARGGACLVECPVIGLWPTPLGARLDAYLDDDDDRSMRGWAAAASVAMVPLGRPLANVNRPEDLRAAGDAAQDHMPG